MHTMVRYQEAEEVLINQERISCVKMMMMSTGKLIAIGELLNTT